MIAYTYRHEDGSELERYFHAGEAPSRVRFKGKTYGRVFGGSPSVKKTVHNLVSKALPLKWRYADSFNAKGEPVFRDRQHIRECVAKANDHGENVVYDD